MPSLRSPVVRRLLPRGLLLVVTSCGPSERGQPAPASRPAAPSALDIVLAPHAGSEPLDHEIRALQQEIAKVADPVSRLERLGWLFVAKARRTHDDGFYKLAEQCALCLEAKAQVATGQLLRGHVLHNLHRFAQAEALARELAARRGEMADYGLLGDALVDLGRVTEAGQAWQKMLDLKPCLQSYARAAHFRWLRGDLAGAIELGSLAVDAGSPRDAEALAWAQARLALWLLQAGRTDDALASCEQALAVAPTHAEAQVAHARILLARGQAREAVAALSRSARIRPLPETQWALADAQRLAGQHAEAARTDACLLAEGEALDRRSFALFLASRGSDAPRAVRLVQAELGVRADAWTQDALAWAQHRSGDTVAAQATIERALAAAAPDARILFHAGAIALAGGRKDTARDLLTRANAWRALLWPSEIDQLSAALTSL